jgi:hypothetical protein
MSQVTGGSGNYSYKWDFGNGTTGTEANPTVIYSAGGTYTVSLTVSDGTKNAAISHDITLTEPAQQPPLVVDFGVTVDGLTASFVAQPSGGTGNYSYTWDFGDGVGTSVDPNPVYGYGAGGSYPVTLVVSDGVGQAQAQHPVDVSTPAPTSFVMTTPILPDLALMEARIRDIIQTGTSNGQRGRAFVVIGDETAASTAFLDPFATPGQDYTAPDSDFLDTLISSYNTFDLGLGDGINSFNRNSVADGAFTAQQLNNETEACNGGEVMTRVACELQLVKPAIAIISVGYNDIKANSDPASFQTQLEAIIQTALDHNTFPIVLTTYPVPGFEQQAFAINEAIIQGADAKQVPLLNIWRAFDEQNGSALDTNGNPTVDPQGEAYISSSATAGVNLRNGYTLTLIQQIAQIITGG